MPSVIDANSSPTTSTEAKTEPDQALADLFCRSGWRQDKLLEKEGGRNHNFLIEA